MAGKSKQGDVDAHGDRMISKNRRAHFDFELGDRYEAGLSLIGSEARALRESPADLAGAWVEIKDGQAYVKGMRIPALKHAAFGHEETRPRRLLLHRAEIDVLTEAAERDRMTLIVTRSYFKGGRVKLEIAVGRGKKLHDKRNSLKEKAADRDARDAVRRGRGK